MIYSLEKLKKRAEDVAVKAQLSLKPDLAEDCAKLYDMFNQRQISIGALVARLVKVEQQIEL
mgnify:FL=1